MDVKTLKTLPAAWRHRSRVAGGLALGIITGLLLPSALPVAIRAIGGWDVSALFYLITTLVALGHNNSAELLRSGASREDQGRWTILVLLTLAAFVSLISIGTLLSDTKSLSPQVLHIHLAMAVVTVVASWSLVHILFAVHYAHGYYGDSNDDPATYVARQGLIFPGDEPPEFSDFLYYAFVVGMTCQVSDIQVSNAAMRKLTLSQGVIAFFFNTVILALSVNIGAGLIS